MVRTDENEDGSETHSSRPVGAVAGGGASGGVDALSPPVGTGSVRKHPSGGSDEAQHTQARDTLQIDMGGLNSGHTTVNLEALNGGALPMNGAHATGQNGSSILHMLQNNKKNDTPTYPVSFGLIDWLCMQPNHACRLRALGACRPVRHLSMRLAFVCIRIARICGLRAPGWADAPC